VGGIGEEDESFGVVAEGELDAAWRRRGFGVGIVGRGWREFAGALAGFLTGGEIADDDFAVAFKGEESVSGVVAVGGENLAGEGAPGVEVFGGDGTLLSEGQRRDAEEDEESEAGVVGADAVAMGHGSPCR
jgi:hypothetical protein